MYETLLVATDGSDGADAAVRHAIDLAASVGATLHVVYVVEPPDPYDNQIVDPDRLEREGRAEGEATLEAVEEEADVRGVRIETYVGSGVPHEEVLEYAQTHDTDVIVVGSRGRSDLKRVLVGSTAKRVVELADRPVIVVD